MKKNMENTKKGEIDMKQGKETVWMDGQEVEFDYDLGLVTLFDDRTSTILAFDEIAFLAGKLLESESIEI